LPTTPGGKENSNRYVEKVWDHAAGMIVIEEAGGKVTDIYCKILDFSLGRTLGDNVGVVVTNGLLHDPVLESIQKVLKV
jgi:3'-phosphoadenosine 5'-phosphosulfate (PAPS) 3'-phosphatase